MDECYCLSRMRLCPDGLLKYREGQERYALRFTDEVKATMSHAENQTQIRKRVDLLLLEMVCHDLHVLGLHARTKLSHPDSAWILALLARVMALAKHMYSDREMIDDDQ